MKRVKNKIFKLILKMNVNKNSPNFFIVGAQKAATSSLYTYLKDCKGFVGSYPKEVHFFDREERFSKGYSWYEKHFSMGFKASNFYFEASPEYLSRKTVAKRIHDYRPDAKIIILLREPVTRAYSAWNMYRQWADEGVIPPHMLKDIEEGRPNKLYDAVFRNGCPSFEEYVDLEMDLIAKNDMDEEPSCIRRGLYKQQIERYVDLFGWGNVLVLGFNELKNDSDSVIEKCHKFLGVNYQKPKHKEKREVKNKRDYPSKINTDDLQILKSFYEKPNQELFEYLGFKPDW